MKKIEINDETIIHALPKNFDGRAEVKGFTFKQIEEIPDVGYLYEVNTGDSIHYEVFKYNLTKIFADFITKELAENEYKVRYPNRNAFGVWAWTFKEKEKAEEVLHSLISDYVQ